MSIQVHSVVGVGAGEEFGPESLRSNRPAPMPTDMPMTTADAANQPTIWTVQ